MKKKYYKKCLKLSTLPLLFIFNVLLAQAQGIAYQWGKSMQGKDHLYLYGTVVDANKNVYITGTFSDSVDFDPGTGVASFAPKGVNGLVIARNVFIAKYDSVGNYIWAKQLEGKSDMYGGNGKHLALDNEGNLIITGTVEDSVDFDPGVGKAVLKSIGERDVFIAKYDSDGNYIWAKHFGGTASEWPGGVAVSPSGNISITGTFTDKAAVDFDPGAGVAILTSNAGQDNFMATYTKNGEYIWAHRMGGGGREAENGNGTAVGADGSMISTGAFGGTATFSSTNNTLLSSGGRDVYLAKHDSAGNFLWAIAFGSGGDDYSYDVAVDKDGGVYVAGHFQAQVDFNPGADTFLLTTNALFDAFLAKYDAEGNFVWALNVGDETLNMFHGVTVDMFGTVYVCGFFNGTADFDPGPDTVNLSTLGGRQNACIARYDAANGAYVWAGSLESSSTNYGKSLATADGAAYIVGGYTDLTDMNPGTGVDQHASTGRTDGFLIKLACTDISTTQLDVVSCDSSYTLNGVTYVADGNYTQHLVNASFCDSIVYLNLTIEPLDPPVISVNNNILSVASNEIYESFQWFKDGVLIEGATQATYVVTENGAYTVTVTNKNGCDATSDEYVVNNANAVGNIDISNQISVYPNPTQGTLYIVSPVAVNASLFTIEGRQILSEKNVTKLSLDNLVKGVYLLQVADTDGNVLKTEKIVVE